MREIRLIPSTPPPPIPYLVLFFCLGVLNVQWFHTSATLPWTQLLERQPLHNLAIMALWHVKSACPQGPFFLASAIRAWYRGRSLPSVFLELVLQLNSMANSGPEAKMWQDKEKNMDNDLKDCNFGLFYYKFGLKSMGVNYRLTLLSH